LNATTCQNFLKCTGGKEFTPIPIPDLKNIIFTIVSLQKGGSNWGIKIVQTIMWLIPFRVPRLVMRDASFT
jgi:hypothetical protein